MEDSKSFKDSLRETIEAEALEEHVSVADICAYHNGSAADEARIQDHLVTCRECTSLLLDFASFTEQAGTSISAADLAQRWLEFKGAMGLASVPPTATVVDIRSRRPFNYSTVGLAIAASLLLVAFVGIWWMTQRGQESGIARREGPIQPPAASPAPDSTQPAATSSPVNQSSPGKDNGPNQNPSPPNGADLIARNIIPVELYPDETLRGPEDLKTVTLPATAKAALLTLRVSKDAAPGRYSATAKDESGAIVWSGLTSKGSSGFRIELPAERVRGKKLRITVTSSNQTAIAEYSVQFR